MNNGELRQCKFDYIGSTSDLWNRLFVNVPEHGCVFNLDDQSAYELNNNPDLYQKYFGDHNFTIIIVHELTKNSLPFIKLADFLIYLTDQQKSLCEKLVGINIPSKVIPYPLITSPSEVEKQPQVLFVADWSRGDKKDFLAIAKTWQKSKKGSLAFITSDETLNTSQKSVKYRAKISAMKFIAVFDNVPASVDFDAFAEKFKSYFPNPCEVDIYMERKDIFKLMDESEVCYIYNKEMSCEIFEDELQKNNPDLTYTNYSDNRLLADALARNCKVVIAEGISTQKKFDRPTLQEWYSSLIEIFNVAKDIKFAQKLRRARTPIDTPRTIQLYLGEPVDVDFAFVIIFRNQADKIKRAIESVVTQNRDYKFGLVIVDDMSDDGSAEIVSSTIQDLDIPYAFIRNDHRRYHSRNLWNTVRFLIRNPECVVIELDGDDFLEPGADILNILDREYKKGILKTSGRFRCYPDRWPEMESNQDRYDIKSPWHQGKCSVWIPLRTYRKSLFMKVETEYFLERDTKNWLTVADDASINARMIELANGKISIIEDILYVYDVSGLNHDAAVTGWTPWHSYTKLYHGITF